MASLHTARYVFLVLLLAFAGAAAFMAWRKG